MENRNLTCIGCPLGCMITVAMENGQILSVSGNTCKRGEDYAREEVTAPRRIVTSTVSVRGGIRPVVSVKTSPAIPKEAIAACMDAIRKIRVNAPVRIGDVLLKDAAGSGSDILATANIPTQNNQ